jgi:hypothetical protein
MPSAAEAPDDTRLKLRCPDDSGTTSSIMISLGSENGRLDSGFDEGARLYELLPRR